MGRGLQADVQRQRELNARLKHQLAEQLESAEQAEVSAAAADEAQQAADRERARAAELEVRQLAAFAGTLAPLLEVELRVYSSAARWRTTGWRTTVRSHVMLA